MKISREPAPPLRPFVRKVWLIEGGAERGGRERVLPTGLTHLALRLSGPELTLFADPAAAQGQTAGHAIVGGPRSGPYVRQLSPGRSVGVQLEPGAATLLFGVPACDLAEQHTSLDLLWGAQAAELREQLADIGDSTALLEAFERFLLTRLPRARGLDPAIAYALDQFRRSVPVTRVVEQIGWSHRRFIQRFRDTVGLTPKRFCRVRRLAMVLRLAERRPAASLTDLALDAGYSDQPHFNREFRELTGLAPGQYRSAAPAAPHHVPVVPRAESMDRGPRRRVGSSQ